MAVILIVEDDYDFRTELRFNLEAEGFEVRQEEKAEAALKAIPLMSPDLIILDWMLPGVLSGFELCRRLKSDEETRKIPIIMSTARGEPLEQKIVMGFGANAYLVKPYKMADLLRTIRVLLNVKHQQPKRLAE